MESVFPKGAKFLPREECRAQSLARCLAPNLCFNEQDPVSTQGWQGGPTAFEGGFWGHTKPGYTRLSMLSQGCPLRGPGAWVSTLTIQRLLPCPRKPLKRDIGRWHGGVLAGPGKRGSRTVPRTRSQSSGGVGVSALRPRGSPVALEIPCGNTLDKPCDLLARLIFSPEQQGGGAGLDYLYIPFQSKTVPQSGTCKLSPAQKKKAAAA